MKNSKTSSNFYLTSKFEGQRGFEIPSLPSPNQHKISFSRGVLIHEKILENSPKEIVPLDWKSQPAIHGSLGVP